jgi:hypothetical protein
MTAKKTAQSSKAKKKPQAKSKAGPKAADPAMAFAEGFFGLWQKQWQEMLNQKGMPGPEALLSSGGLPPGFIPLQNIGPMGLMAPMGAVAMANLKMLQDLQKRVQELEAKQKKATKTK